jgi:hypothetical protein
MKDREECVICNHGFGTNLASFHFQSPWMPDSKDSAGCPEEFQYKTEWMIHVAVHVFTLKPGERTPGSDRRNWIQIAVSSALFRRRWCVSHVASFDSLPDNLCYFTDNRLGGGDDERDYTNAISSPASTPPQVHFPDSRRRLTAFLLLRSSRSNSSVFSPQRYPM